MFGDIYKVEPRKLCRVLGIYEDVFLNISDAF